MSTNLILIPILILSVILHELAHGVSALYFGDKTAKNAGRLTLNPIRHMDPVGSFILPLVLVLIQAPILFGWAKPVPVNPYQMKSPRIGLSVVSFAGPLSNLLIAASAAFILKAGVYSEPVQKIFLMTIALNVILFVFNLIPIPPLDGSKVIGVWLPAALQKIYFGMGRYGIFIIIILLYTGLFSKLLVPLYMGILRQLL